MAPISSRKASSCFCPITRVLPNQRRSGWIRVLGSSLDWNSRERMRPFLSRTARLSYMASRRTCADRWSVRGCFAPRPLPSNPPCTGPLTVLASRMPALAPFVPLLASLECLGLRVSAGAFSRFLPISGTSLKS